MNVRIEKLVTGGQALGILPDGRKVFVWNALPGELVEIEITREKLSFAEAIAVNVLEPSPDRIEPKELAYLSTSPWQILSERAEEGHKLAILREQFRREHLEVSLLANEIVTDGKMYGYRNKVEFGFVQDNATLRLAVTGRRSHEKVAVVGSALARPELNTAANDIVRALRSVSVDARDLNHLTLRCSVDGTTVAVLTTNTSRFPEVLLPPSLKGLQVQFVSGSGNKRQTKILQMKGDTTLVDELLGVRFHYDVTSFFQVNQSLYGQVLKAIRAALTNTRVIELYAGVGSIGITSGADHVTLVDINRSNTRFAEENLKAAMVKGSVITLSSEKALDYISDDATLVVDPPRSGMSPEVISRILAIVPPQIIYLSCDPATLTRDLAKLQQQYRIDDIQAYNFFPRTPHIETLVILQRKKT